ncbi:glycine receptor subunit alpha-2-like protein, partial [Leptotrombidium deliense]
MHSFSKTLSLFLLLLCFNQIFCIQKYFDKPKPVNGSTLVIVVTLTLVDLNSIRVVDMDYRLDYHVVYEWNVSRTTCEKYVAKLMEDEYLTNETITDTVVLSGTASTMFWVPDTYIEEGKQIKVPTLPRNNQYLTVKVSKEDFTCSMRFNIRLAAIVGCQMDFHDYPYDRQLCYFRMRS